MCFWLLQRKAIESALSLVECSVQEGKCITIMTCLMYIPVLFRFIFSCWFFYENALGKELALPIYLILFKKEGLASCDSFEQ